jgi:hypothetical protein
MKKLFYLVTILLTCHLVFGADNKLTRRERRAGWQLLFDGQTTQGWRSFGKDTFPKSGWDVRNGILTLNAGSNAGDTITDKIYGDFDLRWNWRIPRGANNGLKYFIIEDRGQAIGHEYQMIDDSIIKDPLQRTAAFYDVLPPNPDKPLKAPGKWNSSRILVQGNHVEHWLNGKKVLEYELGSERVLDAVAKSKFKNVKGFGTKIPGHILLTYHNDGVEYKNIRILDLSKK